MSTQDENVTSVMATVYRRPRDWPQHAYVVKRLRIYPGVVIHERDAWGFDNLASARDFIRQMWPNLDACIPRNEDDDPAILETWI